MKKMYILSLSLVITAGLLTACGNKKEVEVTAMENNIVIETETETDSETESETESESETETESIPESISVEEETTESIEDKAGDAEANTYTVTDLDEVMYATTDAYTYKGPSIEEYETIAAVQKDEQVKVVGEVKEAGWYEIEQEGGIRSFISADFLTSIAPVSTSTPQTSQNTEPQQQTQTPQQVQETPQNSSPSSTEKNLSSSQVINPATGDYYKPGDVMPDGKTIYAGDFNLDDTW